MGVKASSLPPPCTCPAADLRLDGPQQFLPGDLEGHLAGRQPLNALLPVGDRLRAEENRVQVHRPQFLAKGHGIGAVAGMHDDQRAEFQHLLFVVALEVVFRQVEDGDREQALFLQARTRASTTLGCWKARCEECTVTTARGAVMSRPRPFDHLRNSSIVAIKPDAP